MNKTQHDRGRALRERAPRESHAEWKPAKKRRELRAMLRDDDRGRVAALLPIRYQRMAESAFGFYRGSPAVMAEDLARTPTTGVYVQACGDAHLKNFGGFATPERNVVFDLNDFDETLRAPWEWDLKRLAASFVVAARQNGLREKDGWRAARVSVTSYRKRMAEYADMNVLDAWYDKMLVDDIIASIAPKYQKRLRARIDKERATRGHDELYPRLVVERSGKAVIKDDPPLIFHLRTQHRSEVTGAMKRAINQYRATLGHNVRALFDRFRYRDIAMKVVGVGSVGTTCMVALFTTESGEPLFLQIKEARRSVLEPFAGKSPFKNHGQRVVEGLRLMQAASDMFVGYAHGEVLGRDFYVRQLRDIKIGPLVELMDAELLQTYARLCGRALARAHARSSDASLLSGYMGSSHVFDEAIAQFATAYADQSERDHRDLLGLIRDGVVRAASE